MKLGLVAVFSTVFLAVLHTHTVSQAFLVSLSPLKVKKRSSNTLTSLTRHRQNETTANEVLLSLFVALQL